MTLTLADLTTAQLALERLAAQSSGKQGYHVARLLALVREATAPYHVQREALVRSMGRERPVTETEAARGVIGTLIEVDPSRMVEFMTAVAELLSVTVTIDTWLLTPELLEASTLTGADMANLFVLMAG